MVYQVEHAKILSKNQVPHSCRERQAHQGAQEEDLYQIPEVERDGAAQQEYAGREPWRGTSEVFNRLVIFEQIWSRPPTQSMGQDP